jgi:CDP-glucose 4,6-dehydratase
MVINSDFWRARRVFLTGHTGFKGSWMSLWLQSMGAIVTGFALAPATKPNLFEEAKVALGMNSVIGDIRDLESLKKAIQHADPEIIFHMAAQPLVRYSYQNPVETYSTNVMGTVHLLDVSRSLQNLRP